MSELDCLSFESFVRKNSQQQMKSASSLSICKKPIVNSFESYLIISFKQKVLSQTIVDSTSYTDIIDWTQLSFSFLSGFASRGSVLYGHFAKSIVIDS